MKAMLLFCAAPFTATIDPAYAGEFAAAQAAGIPCYLLDFEALIEDHDPARAVRRIPAQAQPMLARYRGWMLRADQYAELYAALAARQIVLLTDPAAYRLTHELPGWYALVAEHTPRSAILPLAAAQAAAPVFAADAETRLSDALAPFGDAPLILKDYVKSRKHEWHEACYIPAATDREAVRRVVARFLALQGPELTGGLVFREFVDLVPLATHPQSGMPLVEEYRIFFLKGRPVFWTPYWEVGAYAGETPPLALLQTWVQAVASPFFTVDVARRVTGDWIIIELGDGQVAGLPDRADPAAFIAAIAGN